jgi:hypothetical protein
VHAKRTKEVATRTLWFTAVGVLCINLPFGFWRAGTRKFSVPWFLAVHSPVPLVVALRLAVGVGFHFTTVPVLVGAFFTGQFCGGKLRTLRTPHGGPPNA